MNDLSRIREEFPALVKHPEVAYLDSACISLTPRRVLAAVQAYYEEYPGCAGRSLHRWSEEVSTRVEATRRSVAEFLGAHGPEEVVFLRNATEAINLVGQGLVWKRGDRLLITDQEHNSNLVLWQRLAGAHRLRLEVLQLRDDGQWEPEALDAALAKGIRLVSVFQTSNLDGRSLPVRALVESAHDRGAEVLIDGCQAAPHGPVELERLGAAYYALSGRKMLGPPGTGVLAAAPGRLDALRPLLSGGETVEWTTLTEHRLRPPPYRFEAGLQNYSGILGLGAAAEMLRGFGPGELAAHDRALNSLATDALAGLPRVRLLGPLEPAERPSILAFTVAGVDPHDVALFLDSGHGVLVRSGQHCVHSWYARRGLPGNVRASFYIYNTPNDVHRFTEGLGELLERVPGADGPDGSSGRPRPVLGRRAPGARRRPRGPPRG